MSGSRLPERCRVADCGEPRTEHAVFCEAHLAECLERLSPPVPPVPGPDDLTVRQLMELLEDVMPSRESTEELFSPDPEPLPATWFMYDVLWRVHRHAGDVRDEDLLNFADFFAALLRQRLRDVAPAREFEVRIIEDEEEGIGVTLDEVK